MTSIIAIVYDRFDSCFVIVMTSIVAIVYHRFDSCFVTVMTSIIAIAYRRFGDRTFQYTCISSEIQNVCSVDVLYRQLYSTESLFVTPEQ